MASGSISVLIALARTHTLIAIITCTPTQVSAVCRSINDSCTHVLSIILGYFVFDIQFGDRMSITTPSPLVHRCAVMPLCGRRASDPLVYALHDSAVADGGEDDILLVTVGY